MQRQIEANVFRLRNLLNLRRQWRQFILCRLGMSIGKGSSLGRVSVNWPHHVRIGRETALLEGVVLDYCHGVWQPGPSIIIGDRCYVGRAAEFNCRLRISVGDDCLIAAGCRFIDHDHGMMIGEPMRVQGGPEAPITIENDVWLGANVIVLKGVTIGLGAVVAAGAVVNRSVPPYEIWGGTPARFIRRRADLCEKPATFVAGPGVAESTRAGSAVES